MLNSHIFIGSKTKTRQFLLDTYQGYQIVSVSNLDSQIKNYSRFFDLDKIFLIDNPSNDEIKTIQSLNNPQYSLFFDDESFDGRNGFVAKVKKENRVIDFSYPIFGDHQHLQKYITKEIKLMNINLDYDCFSWIIQNCPTMKIKSKISGSKKEKIVYDIDLMIQEITKLSTIKDKLELQDFKESYYEPDVDIFDFINNIIKSNLENSLSTSDKLVSSIGEQGVLLILLSQLYFLLVVSHCKENNIYDVNKIIEKLECKDLLGRYLGEEWQSLEFSVKTQNPIRVRIELNEKTPSVNRLSNMILNVVDTIKDLRNNGSKDHALFILINKLVTV